MQSYGAVQSYGAGQIYSGSNGYYVEQPRGYRVVTEGSAQPTRTQGSSSSTRVRGASATKTASSSKRKSKGVRHYVRCGSLGLQTKDGEERPALEDIPSVSDRVAAR